MSRSLARRWRRRAQVSRRTYRDLGLGGVALLAVQRLTPSRLGRVECFVVVERAVLPDGPGATAIEGFRWAGEPDVDRIAALGRTAEDIAARLSRGDRVAVVEEDGRVVAQEWYEGGLHEEEGIEFHLDRDEVWAYDGLVAESHRGRGIYRRLARGGDEALAADGVERVITGIEVVNRPALRSAARGTGLRIGSIVLVRLGPVSLRREEWGSKPRWRAYRGRSPVSLPRPADRVRRPLA
jgi:hypothetical protein